MLLSLLLIVSVAIGNLCLGYRIAVYLGYGLSLRKILQPAPFADAGFESFERKISQETDREEDPEVPGADVQEEEEIQQNAPLKADDFLHEFLNSEQSQSDESDETDETDETDEIDKIFSEFKQAGDSLLDELMETEPTQESSPFEQTYEAIFFEITRFSDELTQWDRKLRAWSGSPPEEENLQSCVENMTHSVHRSQEGLQSALETIMQDGSPSEDSERLRRQIHDTLEQLEEQYKEQVNGLLGLSMDEDQRAESAREIMETCQQLLFICHEVRSELEESLIEIANLNDGLHNSNIDSHLDEHTGLADRLGLEAAFADWRRNDPERSRPLCLAIVDLDLQGEVNRNSGAMIGDGLLKAIGQLVHSASRDKDVAARVAGQQFVFLYGDTEPQEAVGLIENLRQTIFKARFQCDGEEVATSVSAVVVKVETEESSSDLLRSLRKALRQSKQQQRNYTFLCQCETTTPVEPADLEIEEQCIAMEG